MKFSNRSSRLGWLRLGTLGILALSFGLRYPATWAGSVNIVEQQELKAIEASFAASDLDTAQKQITLFLRTYPQSSLAASAENVRGLIYLKQKRFSQSIQAFSHSLELSSNQGFRQYLLYNLASAQLESNAANEADETLRQIHPELMDRPNRLKLITLQVSIYEKMNQPNEAFTYLIGIARAKYDSDNKEQNELVAKLCLQVLQLISDIPSLEKLLQDSDNRALGDGILFRLANLELSKGNAASASKDLRKLIDLYPSSIHLSPSKEMLSQIQQSSVIDRNAIGVLLPLKGKLSKFGTKSLQGIELALDIFNHTEGQSPFKLVLEDAGEEPESAIQALNRLVLKHQVVAVIGPMLSKGAELIAQRAQELRVPLISLSRRAAPAKQDYVFQAGVTQQMQSYAMARYAIQNLGLKKLAILQPSDKLGTDSSQAFWDAVESLGGEIVGFEPYSSLETDFRLPIDKLSGLFYTEARQAELDQLAQDRDTNHITKRTRKTEQFFALKPVVDYQAVFIPDEPKKLGQIMPTFSYRDVEGVKFLGTSEWNSSDFVSRAQNYGESSFFVDAFFPDTATGIAKKFLDDYRATFDQDPSSLEAVAYDATRVLRSILASYSGGLSREAVRDQLLKVQDFAGATGKISYKDGQLFRELKVLTIKTGKIRDTRG